MELFLSVCRAVQHAHQKGIIHRDLKPSNVLVGEYDGKPTPKVIDFGVAKATGPKLTERTLHTDVGQVVGTLEYMSPEQAELNQLDIDTRSDTYSLGVVLYELLTGTTPLERRRLKEAALLEALRLIREEEPPRPSTRLSTVEELPSIAANRGQEPKQLTGLVHGELDWIVMKCLEKDRNRRYETVSALAADVLRYLGDEAVQACPPSATYRFRKFARRNKTLLATAALIAGSLVLGTLISTWQWRRAAHAEGVADARLETERSEHQRAVQAQWAAQRRLFDAKLAEAKVGRWSGRAGRRFNGLTALAEAAQLARDLELGNDEVLKLRNEAIACLALVDLRLDSKWEGYPSGTTLTGIAFDSQMQHYARVDREGNISVRRLADNEETVRISDAGAPRAPGRPPDWRMTLLFSPDGRFLAASGIPDQAVPLQVWDLKGPRSVLKVPAAGGFQRRFDFSPDSHVVAASRTNGSIWLYDVATGKELGSFSVGQPIHCLRFHPRGGRLAVSTGSVVHVLDLTGHPQRDSLSHPRNVPALSWSTDGQLLAAACDDRQVYVWDVARARRLSECKVRDYPASVAFNQRGDLLATAGGDTTQLWDPRRGKELFSTSGVAADFSSDDRWLGLGASGADVGRWGVETGTEYRSLNGHPLDAKIVNLDTSPDGRLLASAAPDGVLLWDLAAGQVVATLPIGPSQSVIFDRAGRFLITSGSLGTLRWPIRQVSEPNLARWQLGPAELISAQQARPKYHASLSEDGRILAAQTGDLAPVILDLERPGAKPRCIPHMVSLLRLSPDGKWLATNAENAYESKLLNAQSGEWVRDFPGMRNADLAFSPDNRWLVFATAREYTFHRVGSWEAGLRLARDSAGYQMGPVAFSRDAKTVAISHSPRVIRLIDPESGQEIATLEAPVPEELSSLCFTPDGKRLAVGTASGMIQLWDLGRIRERLLAMGLDWQSPAEPSSAAGDSRPLQVEVDLDDLATLAQSADKAVERVEKKKPGNAEPKRSTRETEKPSRKK